MTWWNDVYWASQILLNYVIAASIPMLILVVHRLRSGSEVEKRLREELENMKRLLEAKDAQVESIRREYEARMRELHERIAMLESIDRAIRSGKIRLVEIASNKECRVLVDGTILCDDHVLQV